MEKKHLFISALGVGIGVGLGLASGHSMSKWAAASAVERIEHELRKQVVDGKDSEVSFDEFPYYLCEQTRVLLTSAAYVHLKQADLSKYIRNLSPASRAILLSGSVELYQQMLAKALASYFEAKLLLLDVTDFSLKVQSKYGTASKDLSLRRSTSETAFGKVSNLLGSFYILPQKEECRGSLRGSLWRQSSGIDIRSRTLEEDESLPKLQRNVSASADIGSLESHSTANPVPLRRASSWAFDEKVFIQSLYKVLVSASKSNPIVLYIRDIENLLYRSESIYFLFQRMLKKLTGPVLVLGSRLLESGNDYGDVDEKLTALFPYNIEIKPPEDESHLVSWKSQLEEGMKTLQVQDNRNHISEVLAANDLDCDDLGSICIADTMILGNYIEEIIVTAVSYHLMNHRDPEYRNGKLVISSKSLSHGLSIFQVGKDSLKLEANDEATKDDIAEESRVVLKSEVRAGAPAPENKCESEKSGSGVKRDGENENSSTAPKLSEFPPDNEFEKRIRPEVIPASEIGVTFDDIGALDDIKESLEELVMLPLRRPDLFRGGLLKPCRGILLFGPPGTGKTMLAKAIASEAGASFINVSMSTITSKWFGEDEKNVRALFTLAAKVSPTIIFVDEVDSMLGQRTRVGEHEAMRKIKNEFMTHWDGLLTKPGERILVLAATNRPFDLDEAIIRRFERRVMVGLPSVENREKILKTLLSKEKVAEELDFKELALMTDGYSGSDLKNLCTAAAYRPVRELIQREKERDLDKKQKVELMKHSSETTNTKDKTNTNQKAEQEKDSTETTNTKEETDDILVTLRPLNMEDMKLAKDQVSASFSGEGSVMSELKQWNELYGEGGSRKKQQLSYFL